MKCLPLCSFVRCAFAPALLLAAFALAGGVTAPPAQRAASGTGTLSIHRDHSEAIGTFDFSVEKRGSRVTGRMEFAAEDHGGKPAAYPHIIVRVEQVEAASFRQREVRFSGEGWLQGATVDVEVTATDGVTEEDADHFSIICTDSSGVVYEAEGSVFIGSINFGS